MTLPLLLDTCAIIWMGENESLSDEAVFALDTANDRGERVHLSPISAWEIGMLASKERIASPLRPEMWFNRFLAGGNFVLSELSPEILISSSFLPGVPPSDPIDRIIISTARENNLTLVTRDRKILEYGEAGYVNILKC
jgi:PIN domain nuclease of toxin-antitoxin system